MARRVIRATAGVFVPSLLAVAVTLGSLAAIPACGGGGGTEQTLLAQVVSVSPPDGTTNVPITATAIRVIMDRDMDPTTIGGATVFVNESGTGGLVQGFVSYDGATRTIAWTLAPGQSLNPFFPGVDVLSFERSYTITLTNGIKSKNRQPLKQFGSTFRTETGSLGLAPGGSAPAAGATNALVDPFFRLINGTPAEVTLQFRINVGVEPATVTPTGNAFLRRASGPAPIPGTTTFDVASNTICWIPSNAANQHPGFPGEPLLATSTAYVFVVTTAVKPTNTALPAPASDLLIPFTTGAFPIRAPLPVVGSATVDLVLNEVMAEPDTGNVASDTNGDGVTDAEDDEFVEIVNVSATDYIDLTTLRIQDSTTTNEFYTFPATAGLRHRNMLAPGRAVVVYGGGAVSAARQVIGRSKVHIDQANPQGVYNNGGVDTVRVVGAISSDNRLNSGYTFTIRGRSLTLNPDLNQAGGLIDHGTAVPGTPFSPGLKVNAQVFP